MSGSVFSGIPNSGPGLRAGTAYVTVDGDVLDISGDAKYDTTNLTRETLIGQSGVQGFKEMPKPGMIGWKTRDAGNMTVGLFIGKRVSSVVMRLANGKQVAGNNMWCTKCDPVETQEGTFELEFHGATVTEIPL
jgi:tail tube protein